MMRLCNMLYTYWATLCMYAKLYVTQATLESEVHCVEKMEGVVLARPLTNKKALQFSIGGQSHEHWKCLQTTTVTSVMPTVTFHTQYTTQIKFIARTMSHRNVNLRRG